MRGRLLTWTTVALRSRISNTNGVNLTICDKIQHQRCWVSEHNPSRCPVVVASRDAAAHNSGISVKPPNMTLAAPTYFTLIEDFLAKRLSSPHAVERLAELAATGQDANARDDHGHSVYRALLATPRQSDEFERNQVLAALFAAGANPLGSGVDLGAHLSYAASDAWLMRELIAGAQAAEDRGQGWRTAQGANLVHALATSPQLLAYGFRAPEAAASLAPWAGQPDRFGDTPSHVLWRTYAERLPPPNAPIVDESGMANLMNAYSAARVLNEAGADPQYRNAHGESPDDIRQAADPDALKGQAAPFRAPRRR